MPLVGHGTTGGNGPHSYLCPMSLVRISTLKVLRLERFACGKISNEFHQFFLVHIRNSPKSHSRLRPVNHIVTLKGRRRRRLRVVFLCGPNEKVDDVFVALKNQRGDAASAKIIEPPPIRGNPCSAKFLTGGEKSSLPLIHGLTVCWSVDTTSSI